MSQHHSPLIESLEHLTTEVARSFGDIQKYLGTLPDRVAAEDIVTAYLFKLLSVGDWMKTDNPEERERILRRHLEHDIALLQRTPIERDINVAPLRRPERSAESIEDRQASLNGKLRSAVESLKLVLAHFREQPTETLQFGRVTLEPRSQQGPYFLLPSIQSNLEVMVQCDFSALHVKPQQRPKIKDIVYRERRGDAWVSLQRRAHSEALLMDVYGTIEHGIEAVRHWFDRAQVV